MYDLKKFTRKQLINHRDGLIDAIDYFKHSGQPYQNLEKELIEVESILEGKNWHNDNRVITVMNFY